MTEYIERAAVHRMMVGLPKYVWKDPETGKTMPTVSSDDVNFGVDKLPAAEVVQVRHGVWVDWLVGQGLDNWHKCSLCGDGEELVSNFCPNCGAKMDGRE